MMASKGPPAKGARGLIPGADALGIVEETPLATAGGTRPPAIPAAPPPPEYQEARRSHPLLLMSSCILFDGTGNPEKASSTRLLGKADLNGLQHQKITLVYICRIRMRLYVIKSLNDIYMSNNF